MIEHKKFKCPCGEREWVIMATDQTGVEYQPPGTVIDHACDRVAVYRDFKGLKRYFQKHELPREDEASNGQTPSDSR